MNFYSHPEKLLIQHLIDVRDYSIEQIPQEYKDAYEIIALCHDFGKYTSYFQQYLISKNKFRSKLSNHGFISATFGAYLGLGYFGEDNLLPLFIYNAIIHHHGNLESFSESLPNRFQNISKANFTPNVYGKISIAKIQMEDIKSNYDEIEKDMKMLNMDEGFKQFIEEQGVIENTLGRLKRLDVLSRRNFKSEYNYFIHQLLYSALISADKISASNTMIPEIKYVDYGTMDIARINKFGKVDSLINKIRTDIFNEVMANIEKEYENGKIFSITSPTGTGKTITGFFAALKIRELIGEDRKIIYSLPFTSIIEQNYDVIYDLFNLVENFDRNHSSFIIKHHNLSTVEYENEYRDYLKTEAELLIENWSSSIIVTTFVQLLETLIGSRNRMLKKFNSIKGSIIILDEIQAIDIEYFKVVDYILKMSCKYLDTRIIIMTATKPIILSDSIELLGDNKVYFKQFNRTKIIPRLENKNINEFAVEFKNNLENKSYMIVCNTINQSLEIYNELKELKRDIYYLSTNILPIHRKKRIEEINRRLKVGENIILVSTQVVEAGVDLDFDIVIRDLGPLDSIIQCAGRCNRNNKNEIGEVYIYSMVNESGELYGNYIYGNTLMNITRNLINKKDVIYENDYYELINEYFKKVKEDKSFNASDEYIESIENLLFSGQEFSLDTFSLIKNNPSYIDVFFIYDDMAELTYEKYKSLSLIKDYTLKRETYLGVQSHIKDYTLSIPDKYFRNFVAERGIIILPREGINQYYNLETGFIRNDNDECLIF